MGEETIRDIFIEIASRAMDLNREIRLEKGRNTSKSTLFGGVMSNSDTNYDSLTMNIYSAEDSVIQEEEETEEEEED